MRIYHNPRCSKSRQTLDLIQDAGIDPEVQLYLENPPSADELRDLLQKLGISAQQLLRKKEADYKTAGLSSDSSEEEVINAMLECPKLIERPIVVKGEQAILGRPPENVYKLLDK
ncbi:MAG: arsenate reductase (glutaredoxin) [Salinisphaeraceae bacterium]|nr:arsenate reductase (glutaredoxin) [Salinisphaeraceae bacterium]